MTAPGAEAGDPREPITTVLVDHHRITRAGLRLLLDAQPGLAVVAEADDVAGGESVLTTLRPRVLVLDIATAQGLATPAIKRLRAAAPRTQVIVLTAQTEPELVADALRAGAMGFVRTDAPPEELIAAIRAADQGRTYFAGERGGRRVAAEPGPSRIPDDLSGRELEVLRLIALGHTNAEIAGQLYLSVRTVESHRAHIQQKTGRSSRAELVAYAREYGQV